MGLGREEAISGSVAEWESFRDMIRSLDDRQWKTPSRCEGFTVGDVARHVVGTAADVAAGQAGTHTPEEEVEARKGRTPAEVADELEDALGTLRGMAQIIDDNAWNGPSPVPEFTMRQGILVLFYDAYVHGDDIRTALGMPSVRGTGLDASVEYLADHLTDQGWGPATLALDGMDKFPVGQGDGPTVTADPLQFVLVATGRADPAPLGLDETVNIYREG